MKGKSFSLLVYSARVIIEDYFRLKNQEWPNFECSNEKVIMRQKIMQENYDAVDFVLARMTEKKKNVMQMRFGEQKKEVAIAFVVDCPERTVHRWILEFVRDVAAELTAEINYEQLIFRWDEIDIKLERLGNQIREYTEISTIIDYKYLKNLKRKNSRLQELQESVRAVFGACTDREKTIISRKCLGEPATDDAIAAQCFVSRALVNAYLKKFEEQVNARLKPRLFCHTEDNLIEFLKA